MFFRYALKQYKFRYKSFTLHNVRSEFLTASPHRPGYLQSLLRPIQRIDEYI